MTARDRAPARSAGFATPGSLWQRLYTDSIGGRALATALLALSLAAPLGARAESAPSDENDKVLYEIGVQMSGGIETFDLSEAEFKRVREGLTDGFHHRAAPGDAVAYEPQIEALRNARVATMTQRQKDAGRSYLEKMASDSGAVRTSSGLVYIPGSPGTGPHPGANDQVQIDFVGRLIDGAVFDSSKDRGGPSTLSLGLVMPCLSEALQRMQVGGRSRVGCPSELAYGDRGSLPNVLPGATLEFDLQLLSIHSQPGAAASFELSDRKRDSD